MSCKSKIAIIIDKKVSDLQKIGIGTDGEESVYPTQHCFL
jgi:hypothetical protein